MITATVKGWELFDRVDADVERLCLAAVKDAVEVAAAEAQAASKTLDLEIDTDVRPTVDGVQGSIVSRKRGSKSGVRLAPFFDRGTLGEHHGKLKRNRRSSWQVTRGGTTYTAKRGAIEPGEGIPAEGFFGKARSAGRKALLARIDRGV